MSKIVKLENFRIDGFRNLLEQNLMVNNQLMLEFSSDMIKSCSFSASSSMMKLWSAPLVNFITKQKEVNENNVLDLDDLDSIVEKEPVFDFEKFNFYVLKGDYFKRFLSVFHGKSADIEIHVNEEEHQASKIVVKGTTVNESYIEASFVLTTEEMITNKVEDYDKAIKGLTPKEGMSEFMLTEKSIQEIKKLVKDLHKSIPDNTGYLLFEIDSDNQLLTISDKVFKLKYDISLEEGSESLSKIEEDISFKILKSDFIIVGNHTFIFNVSNNDKDNVIMRTNYSKSMIGCLISKVTNETDEEQSDIVDSTIDAIDIDEYFN